MTRPYLIIFIVLILASVGFGLAQLDEIHHLKQDMASLDKERSALQKRIWDLQKQNGELANRGSRGTGFSLPSGVQADPADGPPRGGSDSAIAAARARGRADGGRFATIMTNPEVQKLMAVQQKASLDGHYASLFKQLQLSPADLDKFKNLLVEKQAAVMDVMAAARSEGLNGRDNRDQIKQLVSDAQAEVDNNIRSTLGDAAYSQYQSYEATVPQRNVVSQLEQRLSYSATPLTDTQSAQLVQILADTTPASHNNSAAGMVPMFAGAIRAGPGAALTGGGAPITDDAVTRAQSILSAQQVSALQGLQQEQQASAQLMKQMQANFESRMQGPTAAAGTGSAPPRPTVSTGRP